MAAISESPGTSCSESASDGDTAPGLPSATREEVRGDTAGAARAVSPLAASAARRQDSGGQHCRGQCCPGRAGGKWVMNWSPRDLP